MWFQEKITINLNTSVKILFNVEEIIELDKNENGCTNNNDYDWTKCVMKEASKLVGCSLNWFKNDSDYPACGTVEQMKKMQEFYRSVKVRKLDSFDCLFPCSSKQYKIQKMIENPITWSTPWASEVRMDMKLGYERKKEYYVYDEVIKDCELLDVPY